MVQTVTETNKRQHERGTTAKLFPSPQLAKKKTLFTSRNGKIVLFLLPAIIIYSLFMAVPLIMSMKLSLYSTTGVGQSTFVGLDNFKALFTNPYVNERFTNALANNFIFFLMTMISQNALALFIAVLLNKGLRFFGIIRTVLFIPVTMSIVLVGYIWTLILNPNWGALNKFLTSIGLDSWALAWLGNEKTALFAIAIVNSWQFIGLAIMLFVAGLQNIPDDMYEAASLDGANAWKQFLHITIPQIMPVMGIVIVLTLVGNFSQFELIYAMEGTQAGPNYSTDVLGTFFYRTAFSSISGSLPNLGLGAAISTLTFFIVFGLVCIWLYFTQWRTTK